MSSQDGIKVVLEVAAITRVLLAAGVVDTAEEHLPHRVVTVPLHNSNGVVNSSNGEDPIPLRPPILHSHMVEVDMQHKVEQLEVVMVVHHKQQRPKDGVLNHHNLPLAVDMDKSQAMEGVDQFGVLATRVVLKDQHHILHQVAVLEDIALSLLVAEDIKVVLFINYQAGRRFRMRIDIVK